MRIVAEWFLSDDGVARPEVRAGVRASDGRFVLERFLIDSGADRTVLSAGVLRDLGLPLEDTPPALGLRGVGGHVPFVVVETAIQFVSDDRQPAIVRGQFAAFTDPRSMDTSILGRDVLENFDVILGRRHDEVLLLAGRHRYQVSPA